MRKIYDTISIFSILMFCSLVFDFILNLNKVSSAISYSTIFKYAIIIILAILIFEGVQYLPLRNPILIYFITATLITLETVLLECVIWHWLKPTLINICLLSMWVFISSGIITVFFISKNIADAKLINQCLEKWKTVNPEEDTKK